MNRLLAGCIAVLILLPGAALAGSYGDTEIGKDMGWKASACTKPAAPPVPTISDGKSYGTAIKVYNAYVNMVNEYIRCVNNEARQDAKDAVEAINRGSNDAVREVTGEAGKLLREIEARHPDNKAL
ncbi:hypothetical protein [Salidesulfovibrio onnuriiensis]|uniref:hypothetical protein n=1 Tax=Salidesulfovibrio onnuriiensis TaxID=2583823 RepID=UPI0011CB036B|nr:hypothetical protein [Salidesulfovibrio onnuriiensis]